MGGVSGERFDVTVSSLPKKRSDECEDCVPVFRLEDGDPISIVKGFKQRIFLVKGIESRTVAIIFYAPAGQFRQYLPEVQKVLDSVNWKGV